MYTFLQYLLTKETCSCKHWFTRDRISTNLLIHTGCENWEPLPGFPTVKLPYCEALTGTEGREAKLLNPASCWIVATGNGGELFGK